MEKTDKHVPLIALFGESEKGEYETAYLCRSLQELSDCLGHPPPDSLGLYCAVQTLLYSYPLIFIRVRQEGYSFPDYIQGIRLLQDCEQRLHVEAICLPGVGDPRIIEMVEPFCIKHRSVLMMSERDLYDYLMQ